MDGTRKQKQNTNTYMNAYDDEYHYKKNKTHKIQK